MFPKAHKHQDSGHANRSGLSFYPPPLPLTRSSDCQVGGGGGWQERGMGAGLGRKVVQTRLRTRLVTLRDKHLARKTPEPAGAAHGHGASSLLNIISGQHAKERQAEPRVTAAETLNNKAHVACPSRQSGPEKSCHSPNQSRHPLYPNIREAHASFPVVSPQGHLYHPAPRSLHKDPPSIAAVVVLARDLDVRVAISSHGLLGAGLEAGGEVDRRRL